MPEPEETDASTGFDPTERELARCFAINVRLKGRYGNKSPVYRSRRPRRLDALESRVHFIGRKTKLTRCCGDGLPAGKSHQISHLTEIGLKSLIIHNFGDGN